MNTLYPKINTIFYRDEKTHEIIPDKYSLEEFEYLKDNEWVFTEKIDGTNIRVIWDGQNVMFGGRTDNAQIPTALLYKLQSYFDGNNKAKLLDKFGSKNVVLYGEGYGHKIQGKSGEAYGDVDFIMFDLMVDGVFWNTYAVKAVAEQLGVKSVPIIGKGTLGQFTEMVNKGFKSNIADMTAEGIVARPLCELSNSRGQRIITKIKHKDFI